MTKDQNINDENVKRAERSKRKKKFIDPQVQGTLVRSLVVHWVSFFVVAALVTFCLQVRNGPARSMQENLQIFWWTYGPFFLVILFLLPVFMFDTIKMSHRFAGPIYRLRFTMRRIAAGEMPPKIRFRNFDFWQGLAVDFNRMVDYLRATRARKEQESEREPRDPVERV